jgi:ATP-dependent DNA helicase RecG
MTQARTLALVNDLLALPAETSWVEFKENNIDPKAIGKRISALSNAARLADRHFAYMLWGVHDATQTVAGTSFEPSNEKIGNEPLEFWLSKHLTPDIAFSFVEVIHPDGRLILLEIPAATIAPIEFEKTAYIRIGSATPRLSDYPDRLRVLWAKLQPYVWETGIAAQFLTGDDVLAKLDYSSFFDLIKQPLPDNRPGIFDRLQSERLIVSDVGGRWNITNLGAILFAKNLDDFESRLARKGIRFVAYDGSNRAAMVKHRHDEKRGYACGFGGFIEYINATLPANEYIGEAFRTQTFLYPPIAIRELIANALIHQDMTITGTGPLIELFKDRLEITNPGEPLITPDRFLDSPPRSRNEAIAALMRRMRICEEQGTGIDKVVEAVELYQLPPPDFRSEGNATRAVLFAPRRFKDMTPDERVRACYQHAALKFLSKDVMKNGTLRERFGIEPQNISQVSQVIRATMAKNLIRYADSAHIKSGYVPFWA